MAFCLQRSYSMALRSLSLVLTALLLFGLGEPVRAEPAGLGARLSSLLRAREQRARALAAEKPGLRGKAHLLAARLLHAGRRITVGARRLERRATASDRLWLGTSVGLAAAELGSEGLAGAARTVGRSRLLGGRRTLGLGAGVGLAAVRATALARAPHPPNPPPPRGGRGRGQEEQVPADLPPARAAGVLLSRRDMGVAHLNLPAPGP
jgi:hypothetical protein